MIPGSDAETAEYTDNWQTVHVVLELCISSVECVCVRVGCACVCVCVHGERAESRES